MKILITAIITAVLITVLFKFLEEKPQKIFVADFDEVKKIITVNAMLEAKLKDKDAQESASAILAKFRQEVKAIAYEQNAIIIDKDAVIGNGEDITKQLKLLITDITNEKNN